ncbi:MAG: hypothetical protein J2P23_12165 [Microlunatus sp.]|nr:hypothetical protein [Microlunatus sp.]
MSQGWTPRVEQPNAGQGWTPPDEQPEAGWAPPVEQPEAGQGWAPPVGQPNARHGADPRGGRFDTMADELAPVDRQADPAHWLPGRALLIAAVVVGVALAATIAICLALWLTPPMHHLRLPLVPKS